MAYKSNIIFQKICHQGSFISSVVPVKDGLIDTVEFAAKYCNHPQQILFYSPPQCALPNRQSALTRREKALTHYHLEVINFYQYSLSHISSIIRINNALAGSSGVNDTVHCIKACNWAEWYFVAKLVAVGIYKYYLMFLYICGYA